MLSKMFFFTFVQPYLRPSKLNWYARQKTLKLMQIIYYENIEAI